MKTFNRLAAIGALRKGKLVLKNARWIRGMLALYDDCDITVTFERKKKNRSKEQLGYLFGVVYPEMSNYTGMSVEELHAVCKTKYLKKKIHWRGADMVVIDSTSRLNSNEMAEFITNVIQDAAELGVEIPEPLSQEEIVKRSLT